jgi:hypothetical protein
MFKIQKHKTLIKDFHKVINNRFVLFNDGDNDIIFTGTNRYSNRILCCIMFEDDEEGFLRYLHVLTSEQQYSEFLNRKISFRQILFQNESLFVVDVDYQNNEIDCNIVSVDEIPDAYLPLEESYCPTFIYKPTFSYSLSLIGGLADLHKAKAEELSNVSTTFSYFLQTSTAFLRDLNLQNNVYVEGLQAGSFEINFIVEITEPHQVEMINVSMDNVNVFLNSFFNYVFNQLPLEESNVFKTEEVKSKTFKSLETQLSGIYAEKFTNTDSGVEQKLIDLISYSAKELESIDFQGSFDALRFENYSNTGESIPFAILNNEFFESVRDKILTEESSKLEDITVWDKEPVDYTIQVYNFSTITGKGSAWFIDPENSISKILVHAKGRSVYENTIFTKSMDDGKQIQVKGIGKTVNGKLRLLQVEI